MDVFKGKHVFRWRKIAAKVRIIRDHQEQFTALPILLKNFSVHTWDLPRLAVRPFEGCGAPDIREYRSVQISGKRKMAAPVSKITPDHRLNIVGKVSKAHFDGRGFHRVEHVIPHDGSNTWIGLANVGQDLRYVGKEEHVFSHESVIGQKWAANWTLSDVVDLDRKEHLC